MLEEIQPQALGRQGHHQHRRCGDTGQPGQEPSGMEISSHRRAGHWPGKEVRVPCPERRLGGPGVEGILRAV